MNSDPTHRPAPTWIPVSVVVVIALVAAVVVWRHLEDDRPTLVAGSPIVAADPLRDTRSTYVLLPTARLDISTTRLLDDVPDDANVRTRQAQDDGSFLGIEVRRSERPAVARWRFQGSEYRAPVPTYRLVLDGRPHLFVPRTGNDDATREDSLAAQTNLGIVPFRNYVSLAGRPRSVQLEVTYAGRAQRVDLLGRGRRTGDFAPLYAAPRAVPASCGPVSWSGGFGPDVEAPTCTVRSVQRTPYYPGHGWAPQGRTWVVAAVRLTEPVGASLRTARGTARYESFGSAVLAATADGGKVTAGRGFSGENADAGSSATLVSAPADSSTQLRVALVWSDEDLRRFERRDDTPVPGTPATADVSVSWILTV